LSNEKWFVYEWSDTAGEPDIVGWYKTRKEASKDYDKFIKEANENRERNQGTEYAICHIETEFTIQKP
jgi:hypothetical protein